MISRLIAWRRSPAGIWTEWFAGLTAALGLTVASYAFGWHWAITGTLGLLTAVVGTLLGLLWSIRNDLGDRVNETAQAEKETNSELASGHGTTAMMLKRHRFSS